MGLSTVVDLRCVHEVGGRQRDPVVDKGSLAKLVILNAPTEDQDDSEFRKVCFPRRRPILIAIRTGAWRRSEVA